MTRAERRRERQATPEYRAWKKAYDAAKYQRRRTEILAAQRAYNAAPERRTAKQKYDKERSSTDEFKKQRRERYAIKRYGTTTLPVRERLLPKCKYCPDRHILSCPARKKPAPKPVTALSARAVQRPKSDRLRRQKPRPIAIKATPPQPPKPKWEPKPTSVWEPSLDKHATR